MKVGTTIYKPQLGLQETTIHKTLPSCIASHTRKYRELQKFLCQSNRTIPVKIWPSDYDNVSWDYFGTYKNMRSIVQRALKEYRQEHQSDAENP